MNRILASLFCCAAIDATSAMAYDESLVPKARRLGIAVGKAYVCAPLEHRAHDRADFEEMFDSILEIDGQELAFVFAVGIGYGAASDKAGLDCAKLTKQVDAVKAELGLGRVK